MISRLTACLLVVATAACGGGGGDDVQIDSGPIVEMCTPGASFDISGRQGVLATLNVFVDASGLVMTEATAELLLLLDATQTGQTVGVTATLCDIKIPEIPLSGQPEPVRFEVTDVLIASVPPVVSNAMLDGTTTCSTFASDPITIIIGAILDPPVTAPLPEASMMGNFVQCGGALTTCELAIGVNCVCDQEDDGKPGATLLAMNTPAVMLDQVYVDLRTTFSLSGEVHSSDLIIGEVTATLEQGVLGCHKEDGAECSAAEVNAIKNINPTITQLADEPSTFRAVRVGDALTCAELISMRDQLFPR